MKPQTLNDFVTKQIIDVADVFVSADSVYDSQFAMYTTEFLNSLRHNR